MRIYREFILVGWLITGCRESAGPPSATSGVGADSVASAEPSPAKAQPFIKSFRFAVFRKNVLDECTELTLTIRPPDIVDGSWRPETMYDLRDALGEFGVEIKQSCQQQFAERPVIATCNATLSKDEDRSELRIAERYYDMLTIGTNDSHMKDCLRLGGDWKAVAMDAKKIQDARINADLRDLEGTTKIN